MIRMKRSIWTGKKVHSNSMVTKILAVVTAGILCAILAVTAIIIGMSKKIFVDTYIRSQEKVFLRIEHELNNYHEDLMKLFSALNSSWNLKLYLHDGAQSPQFTFKITYKADQDMKKAIPSSMDNISAMVVSKSGKSYLNREETIITPVSEIIGSEEAKYALENPETVQYVFKQNGYTSTTRNTPVIMAVKALRATGSEVPYGVAYITLKERDFKRYYEYFTSQYAEFYMVDQTGKVVSSSDKQMVWKQMPQKNPGMVLEKKLAYYHCTAYGIINTQKALGNLYNEPLLWVICGGIMAAASIIIFFITRQTARPLSKLVYKMSNARKTRYDEHIELTGSREIEELSCTYNEMLDELNRYIGELLTIQKEKRRAEIAALQMQINPHYIYNTLASIKWLIFQGDVEKSTKTIDAFIALLRSTISNMDEYITIEREIENLKNYVLINNTRYGDKIQVEYFVTFGCEECKIPKMILQPFVENAFFHAFPYEAKGNIKILVRMLSGKLQLQIIDNGVGIADENLRKLTGENAKTDHFSGIGINNVSDRLKLLYGSEYGIKIESKENRGTTVTILIPVKNQRTLWLASEGAATVPEGIPPC